MRRRNSLLVPIFFVLPFAVVLLAGRAGAQVGEGYDTGTSMDQQLAASLTWDDLEIPGFAPGLKLAVIHGDPGGTGDYTIRLAFPDGYEFPVHWHPKAEHLTVLSGSFQLAMGTTVDRTKLQTYQPGDFLYIPGRHPHFGGVSGATVIQLHGMGPFAVEVGPPPAP